MSYMKLVLVAVVVFLAQVSIGPMIGTESVPSRVNNTDSLKPRVVTGQNLIDQAFAVAVNTESGGKHFGGAGSVAEADEPTTSSSGAIGIAQVMPGTAPEAAKLAGLVWDEWRYRHDPAYNRALGKAYFLKQAKRFGTLERAYAAYNAGPGAVGRALAAGGKNWLRHLPKETQNYVAKNMRVFKAAHGL